MDIGTPERLDVADKFIEKNISYLNDFNKNTNKNNFSWGGTDYPEYLIYTYSFTLGMSINKYSTIIVNKISPFSKYKFEINYSKSEKTNTISKLNTHLSEKL